MAQKKQAGQAMPQETEYVNSLGMRLVRLDAGSFTMGSEGRPIPGEFGPLDCPNEHPPLGDYDEQPAHRVIIRRAFYLGACEVTNAEYERFDPSHRALRGTLGFSSADDEAVVFVSWHDATRFCEWLAAKEGLPYRLPTEAEWEYACRAGTTTFFHTGDTLPEVYHKNNVIKKWEGPAWYPSRRGEGAPVPQLTVGRTPANAWGLHDMHGNVEEWCLDWYGPYEAAEQVDPVGRADGEFKVTRGGSHSTDVYFLRSANRMGTLPEDKHWLIGFRVALGEMPQTEALPAPPPAYQVRVNPRSWCEWGRGLDLERPFFRGPRRYVKIPPGSFGPLYSRHNHDPGLCYCPNGDLLAIWYSCIDEPGRELSLAASRLRQGEEEWDDASLFWDAPDRNLHAPALWQDGEGTLCHFCGLSVGATWGNLALVMRISHDNGVTWSKARLIVPEHGPVPTGAPDRMPISSVFRTREDYIVLPSDAGGFTALYISRDNGHTWSDAGGRIAGIHAGVVQLKDGRLFALGRGQDIDGRMPRSLSEDMGKSWSYSASAFAPLHNGQRLSLLRLREGPLFFASFAGMVTLTYPDGKQYQSKNGEPLTISDVAGRPRQVSGLFAALSYDEGETWPVRKLIVPEGPAKEYDVTYGGRFTMDSSTGEPFGYLAAVQTPDGLIQLITSQRHYTFNFKWLETASPAPTE